MAHQKGTCNIAWEEESSMKGGRLVLNYWFGAGKEQVDTMDMDMQLVNRMEYGGNIFDRVEEKRQWVSRTEGDRGKVDMLEDDCQLVDRTEVDRELVDKMEWNLRQHMLT